MAINWDTLVEREYWDPVTNKMIKVMIMVKDAIWFDYLRKIESALLKLKK